MLPFKLHADFESTLVYEDKGKQDAKEFYASKY